ncbi:hypothetical protein AVEN_91327-1 [Araneus ventricosus]|uniref:Uncharacterized protein n=1 Tax=Araneus ventricosus TaxID=182803 RepID=A0A4Y2L910_ARAVE|nr:hypothetical protein AVEN_91327-1 [Araneus ventricosus]
MLNYQRHLTKASKTTPLKVVTDISEINEVSKERKFIPQIPEALAGRRIFPESFIWRKGTISSWQKLSDMGKEPDAKACHVVLTYA